MAGWGADLLPQQHTTNPDTCTEVQGLPHVVGPGPWDRGPEGESLYPNSSKPNRDLPCPMVGGRRACRPDALHRGPGGGH